MLQHFSFKGMPCRQVTLNIRGNKELDITRYNKHINTRRKKESNGLPRIARNKVGGFPFEGYCRTNSSGTLLHDWKSWII